jgi:hypothetical protein
MAEDTNTIVSGLPRSGTSMMMKMIAAGGLEVLTDHVRKPDDDNPGGYYEFERVRQVERDKEWLKDARGRAVKMISALLYHLPADYHYKVIFMERSVDEILASQREMLRRRGEPTDKVSDERMAGVFVRHLAKVKEWLKEQANSEVLYLRYDRVVQEPLAHAELINAFLGGALNEEDMAAAVDPTLYRQRR